MNLDGFQKPQKDCGLKNGAGTGRLVAAYVEKRFNKKIPLRTALRYHHRLGFKLKRQRNKLKKADPEKQKEVPKNLEEVGNIAPHLARLHI